MRNGRNLITASPGMSRTPPTSFRGSKSGQACLRKRDTPRRLDTRGERDLLEADNMSESKKREQDAAHDAWFRAKVQEALNDPRPAIPHKEVESLGKRAATLGNARGRRTKVPR